VDPCLSELLEGNHTVLTRGQTGDNSVRIGIGDSPTHVGG
jgi:hypothetical protein